VYLWLYYPVFEAAVAVGYGEIQRDTARYSWLDTYTYRYTQLDTVGYSGRYNGSAANWIDIEWIQGQGYYRIR